MSAEIAPRPETFLQRANRLKAEQQAHRPAPAPSGVPVTADDPRASAWLQAKLEAKVAEVGGAVEGTRNHTLNAAAYSLGHYVPAYLDQLAVEEALLGAAGRCGLEQRESRATIQSGLTGGMAAPREVLLEDRAPVAPPVAPVPVEAAGTVTDLDFAGLAEQVAKLYAPLDWHAEFARDRAEVDWLCEPLLERGRVVAIFSPPKVGKSLLSLDIVAGVACGRPVLGNPAREPMTVLYVDMENSLDDIIERSADLGYGPDDLAPRLRYFSFPELPPLDTAMGGRHLLALAQFHGAGLVVIDTVSRIIEGDEDSADTFRALYRHAIMPLKKAGLTVLRLDHSGKDLTRGQRGSSAKADDVDAVWSLVHRTGSKFDLRRTHSRTNHGADHVEVIRRLEPLRHEVTNVGANSETLTLVGELDRVGVPDEAGRTVAREALKGAGIKAGTTVLMAALKHRQNRRGLPETARAGAPAQQTMRSARAVRMAAGSPTDSRSETCPGTLEGSEGSEAQSTTADLPELLHPRRGCRSAESAGTDPDNDPTESAMGWSA